MTEELRTLVIYDIEDDPDPPKDLETCSTTGGADSVQRVPRDLEPQQREELFLELSSLLDDNPGRFWSSPSVTTTKGASSKENEKPAEPEVL